MELEKARAIRDVVNNIEKINTLLNQVSDEANDVTVEIRVRNGNRSPYTNQVELNAVTRDLFSDALHSHLKMLRETLSVL
jgi:hypothetical protein